MENQKKIDIINALVDTAKQWTTLEYVYNDDDSQAFSWEEVEQAVAEMTEELLENKNV